jgi:hypothetical protein
LKTNLLAAADVMKGMVALNKKLQHQVDNPQPPVDFGEKGDKWSYKVFGLACELLCVRLTAEQCQRVTEIFMRFLYPNSKVRVPLKKTFEKWRSMMYRIVKYVNVKVPPPPPPSTPSLPNIHIHVPYPRSIPFTRRQRRK